MFIRAYLRASTADQDASRARASLESFVADHDQKVASWYVENASGAASDRHELRRLLEDASSGDILLVEAIDRLSRLPQAEWERLRAEIEGKGLRVVLKSDQYIRMYVTKLIRKQVFDSYYILEVP